MSTALDNDDGGQLLFNDGPLQDPEERKIIFATLDSFRQYRASSHYNATHRRRQNLYALPQSQWKLLASPPFNILDTLTAVDDAIDCNADIADAILMLGLQNFGLPEHPAKDTDQDWHGFAKPNDMAKAHSTIRQFYRDWSAEGFVTEIQPILEIILSDLASFTAPVSAQNPPHLLLPGAGLARLLFELAIAGYSVEGNEISYHQLLASNFVLNSTVHANQFKLYPFATTFTNNATRQHQLQAVSIPEVHPASAFADMIQKSHLGGVVGHMNMAAGDFLTSYSGADNEQTFDALVSVYFIDTAPNLIRYIETVRNCLKNEGIWINIGPLLWHFDDRRLERGDIDGDTPVLSSNAEVEDAGIGEPGSFELTEDEVLALVAQMGFEITEHEQLSECLGGYIQNPNSMIQNRYRCSHWVARRRDS